MRIILTFLILLLLSPAIQAGESEDKFRVDGATLFYDNKNMPDGSESEIEVGDPDVLLGVLRQNPQVTLLTLNSGGGDIWAGEEMARIVIDFELDTNVQEECSSSCVSVFLAGTIRTMERGGKIGFHGRNWSSASVEKYYTRNRNEEGWETPFDFGSWIYRDTQDEVFEELSYIVGRGVDPGFAIQTIRLRNSMWYPTRSELTEAHVLRN